MRQKGRHGISRSGRATAGKRLRRSWVPLVASAALLTTFAVWSPQAGAAAAAATGGSLFSGSTPESPADPSTDPVELGVQFTSSVRGWVTGVSYYKMSPERAVSEGTVWAADGSVLARATFPSTSVTEGWVTVALADPVEVAAGERYVVSYSAPAGQYADDQFAFNSRNPFGRGPLTATAGVYGNQRQFPDQTWHDSNYYADPVFTTVDPDAPTRPGPRPTTVTSTSTRATTSQPTTATPSSAPSTLIPTTSSSTNIPVLSSKPGASNTGVPDGQVLTRTGSLVLSTPNQVLSGLDINGSVDVEASGVVIKNSRIHGSGSFGVLVRSGSVTISDSEVYGFENAIGGDDWAGYRLDIHGTYGDGVKLGSRVTLADSWIHDLTPAAGAHADGAQMQSGVVNLVVRHNVIDMSTAAEANSAIFMAPDLGPSTDGPVLVTGNWLDGGNYTVYCVDGNDGQYLVKNISIIGNRFGHAGYYGPARVNVPIVQSLNVWDNSGISLTL